MEPPRFPDAPLPTVRAAPGAPACLCLPLPAGTPPFRYTWSRADASLDGRFAVSDDAGGVRLTISSAQTTDTGVYTLQATNASGAATARARLEVSADEAPSGTDPPTFLRRLQDLTVRVGTRTRLLVEILSDTHCKVTWYRNERRLLEAERVSLVKDGNFWCADVAAVSVDDAGRWTCTAENAGGRASCSAHLNVLVPKAYKRPEFVEELRAILTEQGTVSLECKVVGVPTPVLRWFKDSREIKAGDVFALTANAEDPTSLGTYTCEAVNCMGRAYSSSKVHVMGRAGDGSRPASSLSLDPPPIFTTELAQQHAKICEPLTLAVQLVVPPWPRSVVWYNKEGKIENGDRYHVLEDGVGGYMLEIPSAEYPDEGEWKCVATTSGGRVGISSCYVTMDVPKNYRKPRFMENLQAVLTEEGLVSFECKVVGFPTPVLSWFKDGQELKPGDVYQLTGTNSLGSYCCIARNCMGQARSSAELTVEDIQNQLNEEEKLHLFSKNQAPNFITGLKSVEAKIDEPFRFTVKVAIPPEPSVLWYRDDQPVDESSRNHLGTEEKGIFFLDIQNLEFLDQAEWKCVAMNDFGHSVTSCFLKLIIPRHYKKPRFLENLQAILSEEGAVNLECKVIGVPQPVLKWYKDGEELKSGDIHRIISGQDGTCCLGTYTCEAQNCMGIAASSASLLGFEDSMKAKAKKLEEQALQRNLSLSTIHEERTSQMYDTPVGDITLDEKGEISFSFDGKEVSVSLYETPDLTEEEALQIVEMYADQLSENVTEHNVVELPPLRFVKETSTSGNLLMEAIIIDVSPEYFASTEEDLRTEADVEDISIADENGPPQLSLDTDIGGEDYLEKTMALLSDEKSDLPKKSLRKKSDSQRSVEDYFSLSRDQSFSEEKRDDDTQVISETELMSFASARSSTKQKSRTSKQSFEEAHDLAETPKPMEFKEESQKRPLESDSPVTPRPKRERRTSRSSRRSSSGSEKSFSKLKAEEAREQITAIESLAKESMLLPTITDEEFRNKTTLMSTLLSKVINDVQIVERDIILKSELMSSAATASRSLEIISNLITPLSEIQSVSDAIKDLAADVKDLSSSMFNRLPPSLKKLQQSLAMIEKCIEVESDSKTLVKKTCVAFIETCGEDMQQLLKEIKSITKTRYLNLDEKAVSEIEMLAGEMTTVLKLSADTIKTKQLLSEASEIKIDEPTFEAKHLRDTQKAVFELRSPVNSLLCIAESAETGKIIDVSKVKTSDIIMNDMSASIQDLQTALEQIESLSVKESTTALHKYNTEIIETVMESVLKLRSSFELLSTETRTEENKDVLKQTLTSIKQNLSEISSHIDTIEKNVGPLDILQSDNKLEVLQKMAQILIALENNLPNFESLPEIKNHMDIFHKNLTKVLENVIESNDGKKYFALLQICDAVNRMNTSIKTIDTDILLSLASLSNTVKIIQDHIISNVFQSELNCAMLSNIADILVGIQEAINHAEEISINVDSEHLQDLSIKEFEINKANVIVEHINQTICAITNVKSMEATAELKTAIAPTLESICPILEELKRYVATSRVEKTEMEHVSAMSDFSMAETLAAPLCELNQNIIILNQMIMENIEHIKDSGEIVSTIAEPLHELHITLEVLQQDVISQYGEELTPYEVSVNIASAVQNLQSCILMIQDQAGIEGIDEMSTLEDVSGLKTTADTIPEEFLFASSVAETPVEQGLVSMDESLPLSETAQELNILNEHLTILKTPEILDALDTLSEVSDYSSLKSVAVGLGELYSGIEEILQPIVMESSTELSNLINPSKLTSIAVPMQELQQYLSVLDINNIPIYEHILEMPIEKIHSVFQSITQFKAQLEKCLQVIFPAMENADKDVETVHKVECLREVCENMKETIESTTLANEHKETLESLGTCVQNLLQATETSNELKMEKVKCIAQELYDKIQNAEEDMIQFTPMTPEKLAQEAKLFQSVSEVEKNIAVLEQFDFVDVSKVSDITPCTTPQLAMELEVDSLLQIDDVVENAVNVLQNSVKEMPVADLMIVEDFFKTCKNEFTILRCLVAKPVSHKKLIRILQEFTNLQISINDFKIKCLDLNLTEEIKNNLVTFMIHADDCLKNVQESLIRIIDSQSELLFKTPAVKLDNNIKKLHASIKEEKEFVVKNIVEHFIALSEIAIISVENIDRVIKDELTNPNSIQTKPEERKLVQYVEDLEIFLENEIRSQSVDSPNKEMLSELLDCLHKHQDYKDAIGSGKSLIIIKCLAECSEILQLKVLKSTLTQETVEEMEIKEGILKTILTEMLAPLQAFQSQIKNIQQKIVSDPHDESASLDISTTESFVHTMTEIHKEIAQIEQNISEGSAVNNEDISLLMEVDKEIHTIQDSIKAIDNTSSAEKVREISKPIEDIEKTLHSILSSELARTESKDKLVTAESADLSQVLEKYVSPEIVQALEEISTVIEVNELKQSIELARELKDNIATINSETKSEIIEKAINTQIILEQELQNALSVVQVQAIQNTEKLCNVVDAIELKKVNDVVAELQAEVSYAIMISPELKISNAADEHLEISPVDIIPEASTQVFEEVKSETNLICDLEVETSKKESVETTTVTQEGEIAEVVETVALTEDITEQHITPETVAVIQEIEPVIVEEVVSSMMPVLKSEDINENVEVPARPIADKSIVTLLQHIDDFVSSEITDVVDELSKTVQDKQITETFAIARELREKIEASEIINVSELNGELSESFKVAQAQQEALAQQLQSSLEVLQEYALNSADEIISSVSLDSLKKVSDAVIHLQDDLISANIVQIKQEFMPLQLLPDKSEDTASVQSEGENTIQRLDGLLQEVSDKIDLSSTDKNSENTESLRDSLDEVQTVIIKLRRDYDGIENESLNETLEDLECSVRSVQLQINEDSPPELLKEACATLQLLVNNIHETQEVQFIETLTKGVNKTDKMLEKCSDETQETVDLLETATVLDVKDSSQLGNIISNINFLRETLKSLRLSFLGNAESLIEKGIEVNLNLEQIEEKVFSLEKDLASEESIKTETKERINSAIHAIFGSISNMRSTILSIQKQYMYENYGKPSENLLKSVKIVSNFGKTEDNVELKRKWKNLSVSLRNVIIHFEDIKFYVNLDKTARIPSDSGLTKCVLDELKSNITEAIRPLTKCIEENTIEKIDHLIHCLATNILNIDSRSTLEVKEKIPIFKNISSQILDVTETLQNELQSLKEKGVPLVESTNISELDKTDTINNTQQSNTLDIKESNASVENLSSDMVKAETTDIDKDTEDLLCISSDTKDLTVSEKETKTPSDATLGHSESKLIKPEESITNENDENYLSQANDEKEGIEEVPQVEDVIQKLEKLESVPSTSKVLESVIDSNIKEITSVNDESIMTDIETSLLTTEEQSNIGEIKSDEIADMEKVPPAEVTIEKSESVPSTSKILETDIEIDIKEITNVKDENNMADLETTLKTGEIKNDEIVGIEKVSEAEVTEEKIEKSEPVLSTSKILEKDIESDINEIKNEKDEKNMVDLKTSLLTIEEQSNIGDIKNDETASMKKTSQAEDAMVKLEKTESVPTSSKILETDIEIDSKELNINVKHENNMTDLETSLLTREDQSNIGEEKNDLEKSISIIKDDNAPSDKPVEVLPSTSKITEVPVSVIKSDMLSIDPKLTESINEDLESEPPKKEQSELIEEEKRECHTEQANKELSEPIKIVLNEHTNVALADDIVSSSSQLLSEENMKSSNIDEEQRFGVIESETNERILRTDDKKEEIGEESINETIIKTEADIVVEPNRETMILKTDEKDVHETKIEKSENGDAISITSEPEIDNLPEKEKIPIILEKELTPRDMKCIDEIESIPSTSKDHQETILEVAEIKEESTESTENVIVHEQNKLESSLNFTENAENVQELGLEKNEETKTDVITEHKNVSPLMNTGKKIESKLTSEVLSGTEEITHSEGEVLIDRQDKVISDDDTAVVKQQILQSKGIENERNTDKVQEETFLLTNTTQPDTVTIVDLASEKENYGTSVTPTTELTAKEKENDDTLLTQVSSNISDSDQEAKYLMLGDEHELVIENVSASITEDDKGKYTEMVTESQLVLEPIINVAIPSASTENQLEKNIQSSDKPAFNEDKLKTQEDLHLSSTTASEITTEKGTQVAEKDIILTLADTVSTENVSIFPSISKKSAKKQKESSSSVKVKSAESDSSKIISTNEDKPTDTIEKTISKEEIQIDIVERNENTSKPLDVLEITNKIKMETPSNMLQAKTEVISTTDEYMVQETVSEMKISDGSVKEVINPQLEQCELMSAVEKSTLKYENIDKEPCTSKILEETSLSCTYVDAVSSEVDIKTNDNMLQETEKTQAELKRDKSDLVLEESETTSTVSGDIHKISMEDIEKPNVIESLASTTTSIVNDSVQLDADLNIQNDVSDSNKKSVKELKSKKKRKDPLEISDSDSKSAKENELIYSSDKKEGEEPTIKRESMAEAGEKVLSTEEKNIISDSKITDEKCLQQDMTQQQEKKLPHTETKRMDDEQSKQNREEIIAQDERKEMESSTPQEKLHQSTGDHLNSKQKNIEKIAHHELKEDDVLVGQEKIYQDGNQKDLELQNMDDKKYEQDNKGAKAVSMDQNADLTRLDDDLTLKQENEKIEKRLKEMEEFEKKQKESKLQEKKEKATKKAARIEELQRKKKEELQKKDEAQLQAQKDLESKQIEEQKEQLQKAAVLVDKEEDEKQTSVIKKEFVNKEKHEKELNEIEQKQNQKLSLNESIKHQPLQKEAELSQIENKTHTLSSKSIESTDNLDTKMTHKSIENTSSVQPKDVQSKIEIEKDEERTSSKKRDEITKDNNHQDNIILKSRKEIQDTSMTDRKSKEESDITFKAVVKNGHQDTKGEKIEEQINRNLEKSVSKKEVIQEKKQVLENQVKPRSQDQMYKKQATSDNYHNDSVTKQNESESRLDSTHNGVYSKHSTHRTETRHRTDKTSHDQSHIESHIKTERISVDQKRIAKDEISHTSGRRRPTDEKERPKFVDHSHRDYTMEFARPSGYRERLTETSCLGSDTTAFDRRSAGTPIYKVTSLVQEAQLRSSLPPSPVFRRSAEPSEVKPEVRHRTKAASEARSILTEKRSGTRDSKRKPVFSTHLTDRTAVEGSRVKLTCSILSSSDPKVTWFQNGVVITNKLKYKTKITEGLITLEVLNAVPSDSAEYCCTAENENGSVSTSANLKVYPSFEASPIPPTFTRSIRDTYHLAENELVLECRIRGQPLPTISWLKDDKKIENNERYQSYYLADGVCRLAICCPTTQDSGKYTCKAENSVWSDQITHVVNFTGRERLLSPNITTVERSRFSRQGMEFRRPHFANVLSDHTVSKGGTIGLQVEIRGDPSKVEWLREGRPVTEQYRNASAFVEHGLYTLALTDVTEKESGTYTCRAWSSHGTVDMNAAITVVQPSDIDGKPAIIAGRPEKDILISVGEDVNISFRVQGEPKPKVVFMKGTRDITNSQRVCKMTSDDYVKFTLKRSVVSDAGTYCVLARNAYGCDRAFVTVVVRQRASSDNLISDWTYPLDESSVSYSDKGYKSVPDRIPGEPTVVEGGNNWLSLTWPKPDPQEAAPVLAYKVEGWLLGKEGGARWAELGITPLNSYDVFNLKQGEEYHFRVTPKNRNGWGEPSQTTNPIAVGLGGERPEFPEALPGQHKVLVGQKAELACSVIGKPTPEIVWMKNGHELEEEAGRVKTSFNGHNCVLSIHEIRPDDDGHYSCEATNEHGRASTYARVAVVTDRVIWEADVKLKRERSSSSGDGEYPPQFTMRLRDRRVQATYPVRLTCQVVGKPPPAVTWFKDGEEVPRDGRHTRSQDELFHTLEIERTCLEDGGVYEAMARNSRGAVSCHCSLVVDKGIRAYVAPEFCCGLDPAYRAHEGEELRVAAVVEAYPSVGIVWYREGVRLRPSRRAVMTLDRDGMVELAIACITPKDAGVYSCTASNEVGTATTSTRVEVIADGSVREEKVTPPALISPDVPYSTEPMFIRKPRSSEAREGDTVIIGCEVIGDPKPDVYWLRDFLKPDYYRDAIHFKRVGDGPEYRLEIPHAKLDYTGAYSVVATNVHGEAKAIISLQILAKDPDCADDAHSVRYGRMDVIPQIKRELQDLLCCDGDTVEFECQFDGQPEPEIKWYRYSELIRDSDMHCQYFDGSTARLRIRNVTPDDEGMYTCNASNNLGSTNSTACLVVYPPGEPNMMSLRLQRPANLSAVSTPRSTPRQTPSRSESMTPIRVLGPQPTHSQVMPMPPKFITVLNNKLVTEGQDVEFHCTVWGHPAPWVSWDKDGSKLSNSFRIRLKEKNDVKILQIDNAVPEDAGMYRITIENEHGMLQSYARLDVMTTTGKYIVGVNRTSAASSSKMTTKKSTVRQTDFSKWTSGQKNYSHSGPTDETENVDGALDLSMPTSERNNTENTFLEHSKSKCVNQHLVCHPYCPPNVPSSRNPSSCLPQDGQLAAAVMGIQGPVVTVETQTSFKVPNPVKQMPKWPRMRVVKLPHKSTQQDQMATRLKPKLPHQKMQRQITEANELEVEQVTMYGSNGNWVSNSINMWDVLQKLNYIG
ncbi:hypothetical protein JYU34_000136 [Plutella xylostella]|uniref:Uncharacterized protein n=1 Tax=Plutella xylostella TaxID=51655 RepID=A0ABQ7R6Y2_PLUXY|nr:hypothetical protein JYU34_000136 [Plutella xylostella]